MLYRHCVNIKRRSPLYHRQNRLCTLYSQYLAKARPGQWALVPRHHHCTNPSPCQTQLRCAHNPVDNRLPLPLLIFKDLCAPVFRLRTFGFSYLDDPTTARYELNTRRREADNSTPKTCTKTHGVSWCVLPLFCRDPFGSHSESSCYRALCAHALAWCLHLDCASYVFPCRNAFSLVRAKHCESRPTRTVQHTNAPTFSAQTCKTRGKPPRLGRMRCYEWLPSSPLPCRRFKLVNPPAIRYPTSTVFVSMPSSCAGTLPSQCLSLLRLAIPL
jgi:hypothetical protein